MHRGGKALLQKFPSLDFRNWQKGWTGLRTSWWLQPPPICTPRRPWRLFARVSQYSSRSHFRISSTVFLAELADVVERKKLVSLVGCNMRFHPGPVKVKQLLDEGRLGKILFARIHAGSYLPEWRPNSDYRDNYAARVETGGGCILDYIHEIDLARWYLGEVKSVFCSAGHLSSLEIETEDVAALVCQHNSGAISEIHLDYVQRTYERGCQIVGELGSIFWDFNAKAVRWYSAGNKEWTTYAQPETWDINQMYVDEMRHFLDCLVGQRPTTLPIPEAVALMRVAFAAKTSSQDGRMIAIAGEIQR